MADKTGYIGRNPSDSSVIVSEQVFNPTGSQSSFTFSSTYTVGYLDVYLNGVRLITGSDYNATDGTTVTLTSPAILGDVVEMIAYKAFNLVNDKVGILSASDNLGSVKNLNFIGAGNTFLLNGDTIDISISGSGGSGVGTAATITVADESSDTTCFPVFTKAATGDEEPKTNSNLTFNSSTGNLGATLLTGTLQTAAQPNITSVGTLSGLTVGGNATIQGQLTYEDVFNVDSIGIITARDGIICTGIVTATKFEGSGEDLTSLPSAQLTGALPAISGANLTSLPSGDHIVEGNTKAEVVDTGSDGHFKVETEGTERLRIEANGRVLVGPGAIATPKCGYAGIDVPNYDYSIVMGGSDGNGNRADNTNKDGRFCASHYVNAEEPIGVIRCTSGASNNEIHMGGGSSLINAATELMFYTAANTTTTNGTERLRITSNGNIGVNQTSVNATRKVEITQPSSYTSALRVNPDTGSAGNGAYLEFFVGLANYKLGGDFNTNALLFKKDGTEFFRFNSSGEIGLAGANYGTAGQVLTSNGSGSAVTWQSVSGFTTEAQVKTNGQTATLDIGAAQDHKVTCTGTVTIDAEGGTQDDNEGESHTIRIINNGSATVGFSTFFLFPSGAAPSLPTVDGAISLISFTVNRVGAGGTQLLAGASVNYS